MNGPDEQASDLDDAFDAAAAMVASVAGSGTLKAEDLLHLYALYKQATSGPCDTFRPSFFDRKARAKWCALSITDAPSFHIMRNELLTPFCAHMGCPLSLRKAIPDIAAGVCMWSGFHIGCESSGQLGSIWENCRPMKRSCNTSGW